MCYMGCPYEDHYGECSVHGNIPDDCMQLMAEREYEEMRKRHPLKSLGEDVSYRLRLWRYKGTIKQDIPF